MSTIGYINVSLETFGGLLSIIFVLCLYVANPIKERTERLYIHLLVCNTFLLFCDAAAWIFKGRTDLLSFYMVRISNFLVFSLGYVMLALFTHYLIYYLKAKGAHLTKMPLYTIYVTMLLGVGLVVVSQWTDMYYLIDEHNIYHRKSWFWLSQTFGVAGMLLNGSLLFQYRHKLNRIEIVAFSIYISLPVVALLFQILFYSIAVLYLATTICLLCIYINIQMELSREINRKELELQKSRTAIMLSQIQPHFLYNALIGIKDLCDNDPQTASTALEHFSYFLRGNLDSLSETHLIHFEKELTHVKDYLYLEKIRFEEKIHISWELLYTDFMLPPLTLQPIVENAVRYGITKKKGGGMLAIQSERRQAEIIVTITDDGVGFDQEEIKNDGRTHIGISNVRNRLSALCGGTLLIESKRGQGTIAKIILPLKEVKR